MLPITRPARSTRPRPNGFSAIILSVALLGGYTMSSIAQSWYAGPKLLAGRALTTCIMLQTGDVLIAGGESEPGTALNGCELFSTLDYSVRPAAPMLQARSGAVAVMLRTGRILMIGGITGTTCLASCELYDPVENRWTPAQPLLRARYRHTATLLSDGRVLVAGGTGTGATSLVECEVYDPVSDSWSSADPLPGGRASFSSVLLPSGKVLIAGGFPQTIDTREAYTYDPIADAWTTAGTPAVSFPVAEFTLTPLADGRILMAGGRSNGSFSGECSLFDPQTGAWSPTDPLGTKRAGHRAIRLSNGTVLIVGGYDCPDANGNCAGIDVCEVYDPAIGRWSRGATLPNALSRVTMCQLPNGDLFLAGGGDPAAGNGTQAPLDRTFILPAVSTETIVNTTSLPSGHISGEISLLPDGDLLFTGGYSDCRKTIPTSISHRYDVTTGLWRATQSMRNERIRHSLVLLGNGTVMAIGGVTSAGATSDCEVFDPVAENWIPAPALPARRALHTSTQLFNGCVLVVGGVSEQLQNPPGTLESSCFLYSSARNRWFTVASLGTPRVGHTATLLRDGRVLVIGGRNTGYLRSCELFDPMCGTWKFASPLPGERTDHAAVLLPDGKVLVTGGTGPSGDLLGTLIYDPAGDSWSTAGALLAPRHGHSSYYSRSGKVLVVGGISPLTPSLATIDVFDYRLGSWGQTTIPNAGAEQATVRMADGTIVIAGGYRNGSGGCDPSLDAMMIAPSRQTGPSIGVMSTSKIGPAADGIVQVNGERFSNGEGSGMEGAADYPIAWVRRMSNTSDELDYYLPFDGRTSSWSSTATTVRVPTGYPGRRPLPEGAYALVVSSNGLSSLPSYFTIEYKDDPFLIPLAYQRERSTCMEVGYSVASPCSAGDLIDLDLSIDSISNNIVVDVAENTSLDHPRLGIRLQDPRRPGVYSLTLNGTPLYGTIEGNYDIDSRSPMSDRGLTASTLSVEPGCQRMVLVNRTARDVWLEAGSLVRNRNFSLPGNQFPLFIRSGDSASISLCFGETLPHRFEDSLVMATDCLPVVLPLSARGRDTAFVGSDRCGTTLQASYRGSDYLVRIEAPSPNPASSTVTVEARASFVPTIRLPDPTCRLTTMQGESVATASYQEISRQLLNARIDVKGRFTIDVSDVPAGSYIVSILSVNGPLSFPLQVIH